LLTSLRSLFLNNTSTLVGTISCENKGGVRNIIPLSQMTTLATQSYTYNTQRTRLLNPTPNSMDGQELNTMSRLQPFDLTAVVGCKAKQDYVHNFIDLEAPMHIGGHELHNSKLETRCNVTC
jgi:hypothetical protein